MDPVREYLAEVSDLLTKLSLSTIDTVIEILWQAYEEGKQVFVLGNGGSAATPLTSPATWPKERCSQGNRDFVF